MRAGLCFLGPLLLILSLSLLFLSSPSLAQDTSSAPPSAPTTAPTSPPPSPPPPTPTPPPPSPSPTPPPTPAPPTPTPSPSPSPTPTQAPSPTPTPSPETPTPATPTTETPSPGPTPAPTPAPPPGAPTPKPTPAPSRAPTPKPSPTPTEDPLNPGNNNGQGNDSESFATWKIIAIVAGSLVGLVLIAVLSYYIVRKSQDDAYEDTAAALDYNPYAGGDAGAGAAGVTSYTPYQGGGGAYPPSRYNQPGPQGGYGGGGAGVADYQSGAGQTYSMSSGAPLTGPPGSKVGPNKIVTAAAPYGYTSVQSVDVPPARTEPVAPKQPAYAYQDGSGPVNRPGSPAPTVDIDQHRQQLDSPTPTVDIDRYRAPSYGNSPPEQPGGPGLPKVKEGSSKEEFEF